MTDTGDRVYIPSDDAVVVFRTVKSGMRGRLVRLGAACDAVLSAHELPNPVAVALGEALSLSALVGSALPVDGKIILQTRASGAVPFLVADFEAPGRVRGYVRFDEAKIAATGDERLTTASLLGDGHLAITIENGSAGDRYQGVTAFDGNGLDLTAAKYFENQEGLPTYVRLAVARHFSKDDGHGAWRWRSGGLMVQSLADAASNDTHENEDGDDHWNRVRTLAATVEDHELLDPDLSIERLLLRLFHEEGVRVERVIPLSRYCRCSRERIADVLKSFGANELDGMRDEEGRVVVTCEFCASQYVFDKTVFG
jgi:molecular chaperone Hsp33